MSGIINTIACIIGYVALLLIFLNFVLDMWTRLRDMKFWSRVKYRNKIATECVKFGCYLLQRDTGTVQNIYDEYVKRVIKE